MLKNIFLTSFRILLREKLFTTINILGLAIGLGVFTLIFTYYTYEMSFDTHFRNYNQIYRVTTDMIWEEGTVQETAVTPGPTGPQMHAEFPEISAYARVLPSDRILVEVQSDHGELIKHYENNVIYTENSFFDLFDTQILDALDPSDLLQARSVVISEKFADRYFQNEKPLGKTIVLDHSTPYAISGVVKDYPGNTHFKYDMFVSGAGHPLFKGDNWRDLSFYTYVKLGANNVSIDLEEKFDGFIDKYLKSYTGLLVFRLQKLSDLHLHNDREFDRSVKSNIEKINILMIIGILVLGLAAFNFVNLMSVRFVHRAREMSIKKILGSSRFGLIFQILGESLLTSLAAMMIMIIIVSLIYFDSGLVNFEFIPYDPLSYLLVVFLITIATAIVSGLYPALLMSSANPNHALTGRKQNAVSGKGFTRHALIFVQFSITIGLMISLFVVIKQLEFIRTKDLGFEKELIITSEIWNDPDYEVTRNMKAILQNNSAFKDISVASSYPGLESFYEHFWPEHYESHIPLRYINADPSYLNVLGIQLVEGENFSGTPSDSTSCIINMSALHELGWTVEDAIGKGIKWNFSKSWDELIEGKVIGVVQDFNFSSLHNKVEPLVITMHSNLHPLLMAKISSIDIANAIEQLEEAHQIVNPSYPFEYTFVDETIENMYSEEKVFSSLLSWFTSSAVLIAILGLFGLSAFLLEKRKKEFGIKKILGAAVGHLITRFAKEFTIAIVAATIVVSPIAFYFSNNWLNGFAYHIEIPIWIFPLVSVLIFSIVFITISYHTLSIINQNPVDVIREE